MAVERSPSRANPWPDVRDGADPRYQGPTDGADPPMNPTARDLSGEALSETIVYAPDHRTGDDDEGTRQPEPSERYEPRRRGQERYVLSSGTRPLEGYTIKRAIGRGGFGEVYYATSDAGKEVALKLLLRNVEIERRGVQQCMNLKSQHLITVFDMRTNDEGDTFVVMEFVSGPSLAQILSEHPEGLPLHEFRMWLKGLVDGVSYLHDHGIVHRDLKPANLFLEEGIVKIGDYGLSKAIAQSQEHGHSASVGTCHYMAPEIASGRYQKPIDIYAIGVILFEMLTGRVPFEGETPHEVLMKHLTAQPDLSPLPDPYRAIVARALAKDPARRPQRAIDLLVPEDVPEPPAVRFIGDGKSSPTGDLEKLAGLVGDRARAKAEADAREPEPVAPEPPVDPKPSPVLPEEEILRIEEESSIFYIGPNTMPPRRRPIMHQWLWGNPPVARQRRGGATRSGPSAPDRLVQRAMAPRSTSLPTAPPPLPSGRCRLAELATSMLLAAPLAALLALPASAIVGTDLVESPEQVAALIGLTLLGAWSVLVPAKLWEGRALDTATRRLTMGAVGVALGAVVVALVSWVGLSPPQSPWPPGVHAELVWANDFGLSPNSITVLGLVGYFGAAFAAGPWVNLTARNRNARFRFWPVAWMGLLAYWLCLVLPTPQPWGLVLVVLVALVVQIVSPWNREAARYAARPSRTVAA
ncbi:hypothetical protein BH23PLA1_BH23PLA1_10730 [soil metagenome]